MSADLRRFDYPLEPVRRQAIWKLDALRSQLGEAQRDVDAQQRRVEELRDRHASSSRRLAEGSTDRHDPSAHAVLLRWLVDLCRRIHDGERTLAELRARRTEVAEAYEAQHRNVEAVEKHREDCLSSFAQEEEARASTEADREWLARLHWSTSDRPQVDGDASPGGSTP